LPIFVRNVVVPAGTVKDLYQEVVGPTVSVDKPFTPSHLLVVQNNGANPARLAGESSISTTNGLRLAAGKEFRVSLGNPDRMFASADINFGDAVLDVLMVFL
jgi:hypothetical protein